MEATINNESTTTEPTTTEAAVGFYCCKTRNLSSWRCSFLTYVMYQHRETTKYCEETKKMAPNSQAVKVKENLQLSHGETSHRQASGTDPPMKALCQCRH